ncbi:MAG TPA: hypothetical protein VJ809_12995 [Pirellulales bacterium]|nr:hypothetical protein [Pirellulales bacterium]
MRARLDNGGLLPPASFSAVVEAMRSLAPQSNTLLDRFSERRSAAIGRMSAEKRRALAYEKETVATLGGRSKAAINRHLKTGN